MVTTKMSRNILKNYRLFRESCLNPYFCRAFKIILILRWIGNYAANKTHNFWSIPEFIADTNHENNVLHVSFISVAFFFLNQAQKKTFESMFLVLIKTKYNVKHQLDLQWYKPMPAVSAGFLLIVVSRIGWLYFYWLTREKSRINVVTKYSEISPITTSVSAGFFSALVFHLHSSEFPPKSIKY